MQFTHASFEAHQGFESRLVAYTRISFSLAKEARRKGLFSGVPLFPWRSRRSPVKESAPWGRFRKRLGWGSLIDYEISARHQRRFICQTGDALQRRDLRHAVGAAGAVAVHLDDAVRAAGCNLNKLRDRIDAV